MGSNRGRHQGCHLISTQMCTVFRSMSTHTYMHTQQNLALATCDHIWPSVTVAGPEFEFTFVTWSCLVFNKCCYLYVITASLGINCTSRKVSVLKRQSAIVQYKGAAYQLCCSGAPGSLGLWRSGVHINILQGSLGIPSFKESQQLVSLSTEE